MNATSSGPCIFGLTTYIEPVREFVSSGVAAQVGEAAERADQGVEDALGDLVAVLVEHRVGGHQVTDLADEQQRRGRAA